MQDLFISCTTEDWDSVAAPLIQALQDEGLSVGDNFALDLGDSLDETIQKGLTEARHGAALLTPAFFTKGWTRLDLDSLTREVMDRNNVLAVWYGITPDQAARYVPRLASETTGMIIGDEQNVADTARQILERVEPRQFTKGGAMGLEMMQKAPPHLDSSFLYQRLVGSFSLPELHDIAFRFRVDEPAVESKPELARQMVTTLDRNGRLRELADFVDWLRPRNSY